MKNKIFKIFVFVILAQILLYACCDDEFNVFVTSFEFSANDNADNDSTSVANEDFYLFFRPNYQLDRISSISKKSGFITTANATSCDETYNRINLLENITITANVPLFGIPAGDSLNSHVLVEFLFMEANQITVNDLIIDVNNSLNSFNYLLRFDSEIPAMTTATFTMTLVFEDNEQIVNTTSVTTFE